MSRKSKGRRLMGEMNVVPYIDVMLVLLIIFMVTAPMLQQGITVDLPNVEAAPLDPSLLQDNEALILSVDADGNFYLNLGEDPEAVVDNERVLTVAAAVIRRNPATPVLIKADENANWGRGTLGMALLKQAGASSVGVWTEAVETETL